MKIKNLVLYLNDDTGNYDLYIADTDIVQIDEISEVIAKEIFTDIEPPIIESWMYVIRALLKPDVVVPDKLKAQAEKDI